MPGQKRWYSGSSTTDTEAMASCTAEKSENGSSTTSSNDCAKEIRTTRHVGESEFMAMVVAARRRGPTSERTNRSGNGRERRGREGRGGVIDSERERERERGERYSIEGATKRDGRSHNRTKPSDRARINRLRKQREQQINTYTRKWRKRNHSSTHKYSHTINNNQQPIIQMMRLRHDRPVAIQQSMTTPTTTL